MDAVGGATPSAKARHTDASNGTRAGTYHDLIITTNRLCGLIHRLIDLAFDRPCIAACPYAGAISFCRLDSATMQDAKASC